MKLTSWLERVAKVSTSGLLPVVRGLLGCLRGFAYRLRRRMVDIAGEPLSRAVEVFRNIDFAGRRY